MNSKAFLAIVSAAAVLPLLGEVVSNQKLCRIAVSTTAQSNIIALPLQDVGGGETKQVLATDVVMTSGLSTDDRLRYWNPTKGGTGGWDTWKIANGAWTPVSSTEGDTPPADSAELPCGAGAWLEFATKPSEGKTFYLYGQYFTTGASTRVAASGSTFVGPCATAALPINGSAGLTSKKTAGDFADGDQIVVVNTANANTGRKTYTYKENVGFATQAYDAQTHTVTWTATTDTIPVGLGFMYVRKADSQLTFTW